MPFDIGLGYATPHLLFYGVLGWSLFTSDTPQTQLGVAIELFTREGAWVGRLATEQFPQ